MRRTYFDGAAIALAAAATGVVIPSLRTIAADHAAASATTGGLAAAHVVGGALGAVLSARLCARLGVRRLVMIALVASASLNLALSGGGSLIAIIAGRGLDGACHLIGVTALFAAAVNGDPSRRARLAASLGAVLVLAVGAGLAAGGGLAPRTAFGVAASLTFLSAMTVLTIGAHSTTTEIATAVRRAYLVAPPALIAAGERFVFGLLTVSVPFATNRHRVGMVLGGFMSASVIALPIARRLARAWGPRLLACRAATLLALILASTATGIIESPLVAAWAVLGGAAAGGLYGAALALVAEHTHVEQRLAAMAGLHAAGNTGHAAGALSAGALLVIAPPAAIIAIAGAATVSLGVAAAARTLRISPIEAEARP